MEKLRTVLALRALERADEIGEYLPMEERRRWSREAGFDGLPESPSAARRLEKLYERATLANHARMPWTVRPILLALANCDLPGMAMGVVALVAFLAGAASLQFEGSRMVNLLGLPLVALLAWNFVIYLWVVVRAAKSFAVPRPGGWTARAVAAMAGARAVRKRLRRERGQTTARWADVMDFAHRAIEQWRPAYLSLLGPVVRRRFVASLHLAAALWATGAIAGLYYQGWSTSYGAYWESTLLDAPLAQEFFAAVFYPASRVFGLPVPLADVAALQWTPGQGEPPGLSALPWFHLYAATLALLVVAPRGVLWLCTRVGAWSALGRAVRSPLLRGYFDSVRGGVVEAPARPAWKVAIDGDSAKLESSVETALLDWGRRQEVFSSVEYVPLYPHLGSEARQAALEKCDAYFVSAELTPDDTVRRDLEILREAAEADGEVRVVFVDAGWFLQRFANLPSRTTRWREREAAWREAIGAHPLRPVFLRTRETSEDAGEEEA